MCVPAEPSCHTVCLCPDSALSVSRVLPFTLKPTQLIGHAQAGSGKFDEAAAYQAEQGKTSAAVDTSGTTEGVANLRMGEVCTESRTQLVVPSSSHSSRFHSLWLLHVVLHVVTCCAPCCAPLDFLAHTSAIFRH